MIEVEKKFVLTNEQTKALLDGAQFLIEKRIEDRYFDTSEYVLTTKDWWLRKRGDRFELKIPLGDNTTRTIDQYRELETDSQIREALGMGTGEDLETDLNRVGYRMFCHCSTMRKKYLRGEFGIDLDEVRYDEGSTYRLAEIELMVSEDQVEKANQRIQEFAVQHGLEDRVIRGKVIEYLFRYNLPHYDALKIAGVLRRGAG